MNKQVPLILALLIIIPAAIMVGGVVILKSLDINDFNYFEMTAAECQQYSENECPDSCIVCPPCLECSSLGCNSADFCKSIGFDKDWYEMIKIQRETAGWETYMNEEYGFEIKCPVDWNCRGISLSGEIGDSEDWFYRLARIDIYVQENIPETLDGWSDEWLPTADIDSRSIIKEEDIIINGKTVKKIFASGAPYEGGAIIEGRTIVVFYINKDKRAMFYGWVYDTDNLSKFNDIFDQIVSTFRFID